MEACYVFHCLLVFIWQWMLLLFLIQLDNISWSQRSTNLDKVAKINCTCLSSFRYSYHRASLKYIYFVERINSPSSLYNGNIKYRNISFWDYYWGPHEQLFILLCGFMAVKVQRWHETYISNIVITYTCFIIHLFIIEACLNSSYYLDFWVLKSNNSSDIDMRTRAPNFGRRCQVGCLAIKF